MRSLRPTGLMEGPRRSSPPDNDARGGRMPGEIVHIEIPADDTEKRGEWGGGVSDVAGGGGAGWGAGAEGGVRTEAPPAAPAYAAPAACWSSSIWIFLMPSIAARPQRPGDV